MKMGTSLSAGGRLAVLVLLGCFVMSTAASAEFRHALVVTNQKYSGQVMPLTFPHRDGEIISAALESLSFKVEILRDGSKNDFQVALQRFLGQLKDAGPDAVAFFYFSGHALDDGQRNYLILSDHLKEAQPTESALKIALARNAGAPFIEITKALANLKVRARFVVIDSHLDIDEPALYEQGQLLASQGRPGLNAADSNNYSQTLSAALLTPDLDAEAVFRQVQVKVAEITNGRQVPFFVNKLDTSIYLDRKRRGGFSVDAPAEEALWNSVKDSLNGKLLRVYLERFPDGAHAAEARARVLEAERLAAISGKSLPGKAGTESGHRVALVIGNSAYAQIGFLKNTINDGKAVAQTLGSLGFKVHEHFDLGRDGMLRSLKEFGEAAKGADWVVIYYAGHGMEVKGVNYLLPVDAKLADEEDVEEEAVSMNRLFSRLKDATGVKVLILDACRDNPFATRMVRRGLTRNSASKGLAEVQAVSGTLIAYATSPGDTALDGEGDHSPYVQGLLKHLVEPGNDIRIMFSAVYETVEEITKKRQQPWYAAQLPGRNLFLRPN